MVLSGRSFRYHFHKLIKRKVIFNASFLGNNGIQNLFNFNAKSYIVFKKFMSVLIKPSKASIWPNM